MPKKRSPGDGGLYYVPSKKHWRAVVDIQPWPDGRRRTKAITGRTRAAVKDKLDELMKEIRETGSPINKSMTVKAWAETWLETVQKPKLKPNALAAYESVTRTWITPAIGKHKVAELKPSHIRSVIAGIMKAGRSSSTARKAYNILSGMLDAARVEGLCTRNVCEDVTPPRNAPTNRGALTTDQAFAVLQASAEEPDGTRWWVALLEGLRQSERLGARIDSLNLDAGLLTVEWALDEIPSEHGCGARVEGVWPCRKKQGAACPRGRLKVPDGFDYQQLSGRLCLIRPKSGKTRTVPLVPQLVEALRRYLDATADQPNPYGLIWRHPDGSPYLPREDEQSWRDILHAAGVITVEQTKPPKDRAEGTPDPPTSHWARHTTATVLMELGVNSNIVGEIVGHQSEAVTRRYQHISSAAAKDAISKLGTHYATALDRPVPSVGGVA